MENIYVLGIGGATPVFIELAEDCLLSVDISLLQHNALNGRVCSHR